MQKDFNRFRSISAENLSAAVQARPLGLLMYEEAILHKKRMQNVYPSIPFRAFSGFSGRNKSCQVKIL